MSVKKFENITINEISEKANLNRGTLYLHYTDKYDLLDKCIKDHLSKMVQFCTLSKPGEERIDVFNSLLPMFQHFEEHFLFYSSMLSDQGITCFQEQLSRLVKNGITERLKTGEINQEDKKEIVVQFMASAFVGVVEWWIKNNMSLSPQIMAQEVWDIFERNYSPFGEYPPRLSADTRI
nr:TetR/AcrR family transcriptional regulator [Paenibacillus psychroresistens]